MSRYDDLHECQLNCTWQDYGVTFMYYPSEFLVKLVSDQYNGQVLHLDSIDDTATNAPWGPRLLPWKSMDVLIFNSWYSWQNTHRYDQIIPMNFLLISYQKAYIYLVNNLIYVSIILQIGQHCRWKSDNDGDGSPGCL